MFINNEIADNDATGKQKFIGKPKLSREVFNSLAFLFGGLGIHDFGMGWWVQGCTHLVWTALGVLSFAFLPNGSFLPPILIVGSWLFAIGEVFYYGKSGIWTQTTTRAKNQALKQKEYLVVAKIAEVVGMLAIIANIVVMFFAINAKNCSASGCSGAGGAIVLAFCISTPLTLLGTLIIISALRLYGKIPNQSANTARHHTAMKSLGIVLIIAVIAAISVLIFLN